MSTIQQLKNFIRHGKQARAANDDVTQRDSVPFSHGQGQPHHEAPQVEKQNFGPAEGAHHAQQMAAPAARRNNDVDGKTRSRKVGDEDIAKIVAEEKESHSKFPHYPGLEKWELIEKMGDGAFSNVYRARDRTGAIPGEVAIKVVRKYEMNTHQGANHLHPHFKPKVPKAAERANILKEVAIMRKLDHPNIISLIDFAEAKQYYYIVLELAPGGELFHQIVKLTYFSEDLSRHVIVQVAQALEYLHEEQGVVHRDIKPENILFYPIPMVPSKHPKPRQAGDEDKVDEGEFIPGVGAGGIGKIKIADFGLSKVVWETKTTTPCGTVGYTAPEIVKDERYSKSVDMWALGCVLYTLLCGFPPFYDESIEVLTEKVAKGNYTFLSPWWDDISDAAKDLIAHLLDVNPEERYTIKEFMNHEWIRDAGQPDRKAAAAAAAAAAATQQDGLSLRPFDVNRLMDGDKRLSDFRSPGAVNLREVFDVSYAVHRQEEEGKHRKNVGVRAGGAGVSRLAELNEEEEEEEEDEEEEGEDRGNRGRGAANDAAAMHGQQHPGVASAASETQMGDLETGMQNSSLHDADREQQRGRSREPQSQAVPEKGYGQHSATITAAARQQVRDHNRQKGIFELNLDGATLLGRRFAKQAARVA